MDSVKYAYPYKDRKGYGAFDCKYCLAVFPFSPDSGAVPVEEQFAVQLVQFEGLSFQGLNLFIYQCIITTNVNKILQLVGSRAR